MSHPSQAAVTNLLQATEAQLMSIATFVADARGGLPPAGAPMPALCPAQLGTDPASAADVGSPCGSGLAAIAESPVCGASLDELLESKIRAADPPGDPRASDHNIRISLTAEEEKPEEAPAAAKGPYASLIKPDGKERDEVTSREKFKKEVRVKGRGAEGGAQEGRG